MMITRSLITILLCCLAIPLSAQEEGAHMAAPPPLEDSFIDWMIGEWRGETSSNMGKAQDYMKCELGLEGQFLILHYDSKTEDGRSISGLAAITKDDAGNTIGYWFDSWRTLSQGEGFREGNISTIKWKTNMGIYLRTTERIDENTMRVTGTMTGENGQEMHSETLFKRVTE